ncbi:hypothetical protein SAMN06265348_107329 [Pedobacter westerhofensis]|uniref:Uncharacterized protein n=1 Tax=Pedobacter westerhofensis TaxID=425512 RepID=A0A521EB78_9SPHI|nr:hypothetical protein SAMN06265348_107329 [Pedobacter westerhofensis]
MVAINNMIVSFMTSKVLCMQRGGLHKKFVEILYISGVFGLWLIYGVY